MNDRGQNLFHSVSLTQKLVNIPLHKHRTAVTGKGCWPVHGHAFIILNAYVQSAGQLFNEAPCTSGTHGIHMGKGYYPIFHLGEFSILTPDLNDGIGTRIQFISCPGMRSDFIHILVCPDNSSNKFPSRTSGSAGLNLKSGTALQSKMIYGFKNCLYGFQWLS